MKETKKKICKICKKEKCLKDFVIHHGYKDKHSNVCKECSREKYQHSFRREVLDSLKRIEEKLN